MPSDPAALLELAAKKNGLRNVGSAPWHLKASYEVLDKRRGGGNRKIRRVLGFGEEDENRLTPAPVSIRRSYSTEASGFRVGRSGTGQTVRFRLRRNQSISGAFRLASMLKNKLRLILRIGRWAVCSLNASLSIRPSRLQQPTREVDCFDPDAPILRIIVRCLGVQVRASTTGSCHSEESTSRAT